MRKIKFRAWDNNKMYYQVRCGGFFDGIPTAPTVWNEEKGDWLNLTGQPYTKVMQYVGTKDCEGKEVFEGDICELRTGYGNYGARGIVGFEDCEFCFTNLQEGLYGEFKVIGNIYENKDLLN